MALGNPSTTGPRRGIAVADRRQRRSSSTGASTDNIDHETGASPRGGSAEGLLAFDRLRSRTRSQRQRAVAFGTQLHAALVHHAQQQRHCNLGRAR